MESLLLMGKDASSLQRIKGFLIKRNFRVMVALTDDLDRLEEKKERFSLGLLEVGLQEDLRECINRIRHVTILKELPLLALVASQHLSGLNSVVGLEDFLVLPAEPEGMEARLKFVLKRLNHVSPGSGIQIGKLSIDVDRYETSLDQELLELTYKEFELLKFLATHPSRVYSRDQLLNQVWGYDFIGGTRTVDVHIRRLRSKLGPKYASLIATIRNVGYKFLESLK